jgi:short-subunit dehydrogenase
MERQGHGHVLNTASFAGLAGAPGLGAYGVAKAAVIALSEGLRAELQPKGIGVSVLCPSFFKTRLLESATDSEALPLKHVAAKLMEQSPIDAAEVARYAVEESERGRFLLLPHQSTRTRLLIKRLFPEFYFRLMLKQLAKAKRGTI